MKCLSRPLCWPLQVQTCYLIEPCLWALVSSSPHFYSFLDAQGFLGFDTYVSQVALLHPVTSSSSPHLVDAGGTRCPLGAAISTREVLFVTLPKPRPVLLRALPGVWFLLSPWLCRACEKSNESFPSCAESQRWPGDSVGTWQNCSAIAITKREREKGVDS